MVTLLFVVVLSGIVSSLPPDELKNVHSSKRKPQFSRRLPKNNIIAKQPSVKSKLEEILARQKELDALYKEAGLKRDGQSPARQSPFKNKKWQKILDDNKSELTELHQGKDQKGANSVNVAPVVKELVEEKGGEQDDDEAPQILSPWHTESNTNMEESTDLPNQEPEPIPEVVVTRGPTTLN